MKISNIFILAALCGSFASCFKDEPLNAECDIEEAVIHVDNPQEVFFNLTDSIVRVPSKDNIINFDVRPSTALTALAPRFKLTPGATVYPESGSVQDFSNGAIMYTVTSEDREWSRKYYVSVTAVTRTSNDTLLYSFETYAMSSDNSYFTWADVTTKWDTGNPGFKMTGMANEITDQGTYVNNPMKYPTTPFEEGYKGKCVKLVTMDTGPLGLLKKIRLAAGNLFIGSFDTQNAMDKPREATSFGRPFDKKPSKLRGFYKYTHGERLQNEYGEAIPGESDRGDIYAVFYRNHDSDGNEVVLNGDDVKTNPHIVAIAQVNDINDAAEWTEFEADFVYSTEVDMKLVENRAYNLAIVCSSSRNGAYFRGAIGSTLMIDELELICTKTEK